MPRRRSPARRRAAFRRRSDQALLDLTQSLAAGLGPAEVLDRVAAAAATLVPDALVHLWLVDEHGRLLRLAAEYGARPGAGEPPRTLGLDQGLAGRVARKREPLMVRELLADRHFAHAAWARDQALASFAGVPLLVGDRLRGVLCLFTRRPYRFTSNEVALLRSFASHAAVALENAALVEAAQDRLRRLEALREIEGEILRQHDPAALLTLIARRAADLLGADAAVVYLWDEADGAFRARAHCKVGDWIREVAIPPGVGLVGRVAREGRGLVINDYPSWPGAIPPFQTLHHAVMAQPLRAGAEVSGVLLVGREAPDRPFGEADLTQLGDFARQAAIALENARLLELARGRAERVRAAAEVGRLLVSTLDPDRILDLIAEKCREVLGAEAFGLFRLDPDGRLRYARGFGLDPAFLREHVLAVGEGVVGRAVAERRSVVTADILRDPDVPLSEAARARIAATGSRALAAVPVVVRDEPRGALAVYHPPGVRIPAEEVEFLEVLANHAATALENARLFAEARQREAEALALVEVSRLMSATLDPDRVLDLIVDKARELLGVRACGVFRLEGETLRYARGAGLSPEFIAGLALPLRRGTSGRAVAERRPVWTSDILADPAIPLDPATRELVAREGYRSVLSVPVEGPGGLFGGLVVYWWEPRAPSPREVTTLTSLAALAGVALESARLYHEARIHLARLEHLHRLSQRVSASLQLDVVLEEVVEAAATLLDAPLCTFWVADEGRRVLVRRVTRAAPELRARLPEEMAYGEGAPGWVAEHRGALLDVPIATDPRIRARAVLLEAGLAAYTAVPVCLGDRLLGVLALARREEASLGSADHALLVTLIGQAAIAIEHARLYEELARAYLELQTAQAQLVQTEKLRALGEMASGVAHDFNNALAAILGRVQLALQRAEDPTLRRWLEVAERAALDASQTIRRIQEFTRVRRDRPSETVDLNQVVRDAVEMTQIRWRNEAQARGVEIRVVTRLEPLPPVEGHPAELREALTNLILNAVDALPRGGTITLATRVADDRVEVTVADDGVGMPEHVRRRIFEPFFTTKGPRGTGLGLAVVYGIVSRHGGEIRVESAEGAGSTFTLRLPVGGRRPAAAAPAAPAGPGARRVLVIDDEAEVRETLADLLREAGHAVVTAGDGPEGLRHFEAGAFDVVLTDLGMPGMTGWQVARAVKTARPEVPVVLVTGWGVELTRDELAAHGVDRVLSKPFRLQDVLAAVHAAGSGGSEG